MISNKAFKYIENNSFLLKEDKFKEFFDKCNDFYLKRELAEFLLLDCDINFLEYMKSIPNHLFYKSNRLVELSIPESIIEIENNVFENCRSLKSITMLDSINKIDENAFYGCLAL